MSADYSEEPRQDWEHSHCCCHHSPQTETEAERTTADLENVPGGGETEEAEHPYKGAAGESDFTAVSEEDAGPERKEGGAEIDLGVPEEDLAGVLEELELSLKMTSMMEREKMEDLTRSTEEGASCGAVRRRNKRRRAKKAPH